MRAFPVSISSASPNVLKILRFRSSAPSSASTLARAGNTAAFTFRNPLHFEDEFEVVVRLAHARARSLHYEHTIVRGETVIGTGSMTSVCVRYAAGGMQAVDLPEGIVTSLREVEGTKGS